MPEDARRWAELLTVLELDARECERAFEGATPIPAAPELPDDLGPLPPELAPRVRALLVQLRALELRGGEIKDGIARVLAATDPTAEKTPRPPVYVDTSL